MASWCRERTRSACINRAWFECCMFEEMCPFKEERKQPLPLCDVCVNRFRCWTAK